MTDFYRNLSIDPSAPTDQTTSGRTRTAPQTPDANEVVGTGRNIEDGAEIRTLEVASSTDQTSPSTQQGMNEGAGGSAQPATSPSSRPSLSSLPPVNSAPGTGPSGGGPTAPPSGGGPPPGTPLPPSPAATGTGSGWSWVVWDDGTVENVATSGNLLSDTDFVAIKAGGATLTGSGQASAFITYSGGSQVVNGTCNMTVTLGPSPTPTWNGSFYMGSGVNSLNFGAVGTIGTAGQLIMTSLSSVPVYALTANGSTYGPGTLSSQQLVNSFLVGPSGGTVATGAHGHFFFAHAPSSLPKADAMFGVNF